MTAKERVDDVVARSQQEAEAARKAAARTSFLTALAMVIGAFVACAAAAAGTWDCDQLRTKTNDLERCG
jgi:hypothetical protein